VPFGSCVHTSGGELHLPRRKKEQKREMEAEEEVEDLLDILDPSTAQITTQAPEQYRVEDGVWDRPKVELGDQIQGFKLDLSLPFGRGFHSFIK